MSNFSVNRLYATAFDSSGIYFNYVSDSAAYTSTTGRETEATPIFQLDAITGETTAIIQLNKRVRLAPSYLRKYNDSYADNGNVVVEIAGKLWFYRNGSFVEIAEDKRSINQAINNLVVSDDVVAWRVENALYAYSDDLGKVIKLSDYMGAFDESEGNIAWSSDGIHVFDGKETTKINSSNVSELQISGDNLSFYAPSFINQSDTFDKYEVYLYTDNKIKTIGEAKFFSEVPKISGNKVVWASREKTGTVDSNGREISIDRLYLYDGKKTTEIYATERDIRDLDIEGNNVVWVERYATEYDTSAAFHFYLYDMDSEDKQPIQLTNNGFDNSFIRYELGGDNIAWYSNSLVGVDDVQLAALGQPQLYAHQNGLTRQLTTSENVDIRDFNALEEGVLWTSISPSGYEVFFASTDVVEEEEEEEEVDPVRLQEGIDRWWATAGSDPITVNWIVNVEQSGTYELDIDITDPDTFGVQNWDLTDNATVSGALVEDLGNTDAVTITPREFEFDGAADLGFLTAGQYQLTIGGEPGEGFSVPETPEVEEVVFELTSSENSSGSDILYTLSALFVADYPDSNLNADNINELVRRYAPVLKFEKEENHALPLDVTNYPLGNSSWADRLEPQDNEDDNDKAVALGSRETIINLSDFENGTPKDENSGVIYAAPLQNPNNENQLAINYWFHYARSNWADHGGSNTHEGDWEGITIFFNKSQDGTWQPERASFAQHINVSVSPNDLADGGDTYRWSYLTKKEETDQPSVYVSLGGHASYAESGTTRYPSFLNENSNGLEFHRGDGKTITPTVISLPRAGDGESKTLDWLRYPGKWGQQNVGVQGISYPLVASVIGDGSPGNDGIPGPVFLESGFEAGTRWLNPWEWASGFNTPVLARDDSSVIKVNSESVELSLTDNDNFDVESDLEIQINEEPTHGTVVIDDDNSIFYTPNPGFSGSDRFTYSLGDSDEAVNRAATVDIVVTPSKTEGTEEENVIEGSEEDNLIEALGGDDRVAGGLGNDTILGGAGGDVLRGDLNNRNPQKGIGGDDIIYGGIGNDRIGGKGGNDLLFGGDGDDLIWGDGGDDLLRGGPGNDRLTGDDFSGGTGADIFVLARGEGMDTIVDFGNGDDKLGLADGLTFGQLSITSTGNNVLISAGDETLATVLGITELDASSFVSV